MRFTTLVLGFALSACSSSESSTITDAGTDSVATDATASDDTTSDVVVTDGVPSSECPEGEVALFDGPGCDGSNKRCVPKFGPDACAADVPYCGCDGVTHSGFCSDTEFFPYRSKGECPKADAAAD